MPQSTQSGSDRILDVGEGLALGPPSDGSYPTPLDVQQLLLRYGYNTTSFLWRCPGFLFFVCQGGRGVVAYVESGVAIIAAGDPLCAPEDAAACLDEFRIWCTKQSRYCVVLPASERLAETARPLGFSALPIGASPYFNLHTYAPSGNRARKVRSAVNQARRLGIQVWEYRTATRDAEIETEFREICALWQKSRSIPQLPFLFQLDPLAQAEEKRYYVASSRERIEGFLACSPIYARRGWFLEDLLRRPDAVHGTTESLVLGAIEALKLEGFDMATLGSALLMPLDSSFVPLHSRDFSRHPRINRILALIYRYGRWFYNFRSLGHYKSKFAASWWEADYCLCWPQKASPRLLLSIAGVFFDGAFSRALARHKWSHVVRRTQRR
jgi:phosphatidylglycerol lysyltransferase